MTPRERILTALSHTEPESVPFSWGFCGTPEMQQNMREYLAPLGVGWDVLRDLTDDKVLVGPRYVGPPLNGEEYLAIWGINVRSVSHGTGAYDEFCDFPLADAETPEDIDRHPFPTTDWYDFSTLRFEIEAANPGRRRATQVLGGNAFELYCWLTGLETAMVNLAVNPEVVSYAVNKICDFLTARLVREFEAAGDLIDLVFMADDLGGQMGLLMSREMYRRIIQPAHRRLANTIRACSSQAKILFHTDGAVFDILPDLIDVGVECLEAVQVNAAGMDPERLKAAYGAVLSFHGALSVQQLLPRSSPAEVREECKRIIGILGAGGGYIAAPSHAIQEGTPPENVVAMLAAVLGENRLASAWEAAAIGPNRVPLGTSR